MLEFCPLCHKNGYKRRITLSQINLHEAVWLCESSECPWPFGYEDFTFVPRKIGEMWSSEWELHRPMTLKPSEPHQISPNELGLDTPPVTPGSGSESIQKDSVFVDNTCISLSTNIVRAKGCHPHAKTNLDKLGDPYNSECGSIDSGTSGTRASGENQCLVPPGSDRSIRERETTPKFQSDFSLVEDVNFERFSCQNFSEACGAAQALTESIFNVGKPSEDKVSSFYDNGNCHESTVKCKKWLSDNTKGTVLGDHCYSSLEAGRIGSRLQRGCAERLNNRKQLPRVKSIEKINVILPGVIVGSNSSYSEENNSPSTMIFHDLNVKGEKDEGNRIPNMEGLLPINLSDEAPSFVEKCVTLPWSTDSGDVGNEKIVEIDSKPEPVVENNPIVVIKIKAEDLASIQETMIFEPGINIKNETNLPAEDQSTDCRDVGDEKIEERDSKSKPVVDDNPVISIRINPEDLTEIPEFSIKQPAANDKVETQKKSMKRPAKRMLPKTAKYRGFNFGSLKKKSKSNTEENIKSSLPNSPDNVSICSDVTWSSESSCMTASTADSKSESVSSNLDSNSKSSLSGENCSLTSSSNVKSISNVFSPEMDGVSESNLNLDLQVLDELLLCNDVNLPQGFGDDWLVSLFD